MTRLPNGVFRIQWLDGTRRAALKVGRDEKAAERVKMMVEALLDSRSANCEPSKTVAAWLEAIDDRLHAKLTRAALVSPRRAAERLTLGSVMKTVFGGMTVQPSTLVIYNAVRTSLEGHFGTSTPANSITVADAERWRQTLIEAGLAKATINKRVRVARTLFKRAADLELIPRNPFSGIKAGASINAKRQAYIDRETLETVLAACPSVQWKLLFALPRLAGLRMPSEVAGLTWQDVDFEARRMVVKSPKTAGCGKASRVVPIEPRLAELLLAAFTSAPEGAVHVITDPRHRMASANLRTNALRILEKAKVPAWPKLFVNLRASCATDWARALPAKAAAEFLGHTAAVALTHYHQTRPEDFSIIAEGRTGGRTQGAERACTDAQASTGRDSRTSSQGQSLPGLAHPCSSMQAARDEQKVGATGLEPVTPAV